MLTILSPAGSGNYRTTRHRSDYTNEAMRKLQKQVLQAAVSAVDAVPVELRDQSSMTMAINSNRIPAAKEKIKKFRRELCELLEGEAGTERDEVYQLSVSLFPISHVKERGGTGNERTSKS